MAVSRLVAAGVVAAIVLFSCAPAARANAVVKGSFYRLGEDDPGAAAGAQGNSQTVDSLTNQINLTRSGPANYSADVPPRSIGSTLSMQFGAPLLPVVPGNYSSKSPLPMLEQGYALEVWAKSYSWNLDQVPPTGLIAYNGTPGVDGFGLFETQGSFVVRIGGFDRVLGPVDANWHHLAYAYSLGTESYFFDGNLVHETMLDPVAAAPSGAFWVGGWAASGAANNPFLGQVDEVRFQSFNPMAAGSPGFDPFLIAPIPEPALLLLCTACAGLMLVRSRTQPSRTS